MSTTKEPSIISLIILSAFASVGLIIVTPGVPAMASFFKISTGTAQMTITAFLLGYALGQLIYGPIANRWGRKPAFYVGITVATLGSLFSVLASPVESFALLMIGRVLEALGSSVGLVICFTIINDFYLPEHVRKITGILMTAFAIVPGIGIATGGFLVQHFGWSSCFYFLLVYGFVLFVLAFYLPETLKEKDMNAIHHRYLAKNYLNMLKIKKLVGYSFIAGLSGACLYIFSAEGPFIGIHLLGYSPSFYGLIGLVPYIGTIIGALIMIKTTHINPKKIIFLALSIEGLGMLVMFCCFVAHFVNMVTLLAPTMLIFAGNVMLYGTSASLGIRQSTDKANASAVVNFLALSMAMMGTFIFSLLHNSAPWVMPTLFLGALFLMGAVYVLLLKERS
jgi:DHA1 family bicyclomycin/chloramphenicol resistance-like MFS transporter